MTYTYIRYYKEIDVTLEGYAVINFVVIDPESHHPIDCLYGRHSIKTIYRFIRRHLNNHNIIDIIDNFGYAGTIIKCRN